MLVVIGSSLDGTKAYTGVVFPPHDLTLQWYRQIPATHFRALGLSLGLALSVAFGACLLGIPAALAWSGARCRANPSSSLSSARRCRFRRSSRASHSFGSTTSSAMRTGLFLNATFIGLYLGHLFVARRT
jgi:hypothetical protein